MEALIISLASLAADVLKIGLDAWTNSSTITPAQIEANLQAAWAAAQAARVSLTAQIQANDAKIDAQTGATK